MRTRIFCAVIFPLILSACVLRPPELEMLKSVESRLDSQREAIGPYALDMKADGSRMVLTGKVGSEAGKAKIEEIVASSPGVTTVKNEMTVESTMGAAKRGVVGSQQPAIEILSRFQTIKGKKPLKAAVEVSDGVARLSGTVASEEERRMFVNAAQATLGVTTVVDNLRVPPPMTDDELIHSVKSALAGERLLGAGDISVAAAKGTVTLKGDRSSFREVDKVLSVVLMVDGVEDVQSQITVKRAPYDRSIRVK